MSPPPPAESSTLDPDMWPMVDGDRLVVVDFAAEIADAAPDRLSLRRCVACEGRIIRETEILSLSLPPELERGDTRSFLRSSHRDWCLWGRMTDVVGPAAMADLILARIALEAERKRLEDEEARDRAEREAERHRTIDSLLLEDRRGYCVTLQRRSELKPFWTIAFRERWERERFRDWWRNQHHRFPEFAEMVVGHGGLHLERVALAEMLATEKAVRAAGLDAGGRRPLRFWRGQS